MHKLKAIFTPSVAINVLFSALVLALVPDFALASPPDPGSTLCSIATYAQGNLGKGVATLAVVSIGIGAAFGRASWTQAVLVAVGISVTVGATALLTLLVLPSC